MKYDTRGKYDKYLLSLGLFIAFVFYLCLGYFRLIDGDEGFYLYAVKLFMMGKEPYLDFFYPQMPAFLYLKLRYFGAKSKVGFWIIR